MALLDETIRLAQTTGVNIDTALIDARQYRSRLGGALGLEQPISEAVGVFARVSKATGNVEPYEFTDIDRSVAIGSSHIREWSRFSRLITTAVCSPGRT